MKKPDLDPFAWVLIGLFALAYIPWGFFLWWLFSEVKSLFFPS